MNILMMTNTYTPHVGGVARSVDGFTQGYRARGHDVLVVAPTFPGGRTGEDGVFRIPAIQNFNGSDFSVVLPITGDLEERVEAFEPDIIHSHHPFLIGSTAMRLASQLDVPLVFTHHTMYEEYTHYVPGDSPALRNFVIQLATHYANQCDQVFAPSESVQETLEARGVHSPIEVVPTGIRTEVFGEGDGAAFRRRHGIPEAGRVIGHVGRLAPEKNLGYLARACARVMAEAEDVHFLVVGAGPSETDIVAECRAQGVADRLHAVGKQVPPALADAYHAMDVFAFASTSETQGMVLAEAMTAGLPVIALDAPGAREVVTDAYNGRLLPAATDAAVFAGALSDLFARLRAEPALWEEGIGETAERFSERRCVDRALSIYQLLDSVHYQEEDEHDSWHATLRRIRAEWDLFKGVAEAAGAAAGFGRREER